MAVALSLEENHRIMALVVEGKTQPDPTPDSTRMMSMSWYDEAKNNSTVQRPIKKVPKVSTRLIPRRSTSQPATIRAGR